MRHEYRNDASIPSQGEATDRRANQKARTRAALIEAAGELLRQGLSPTVADAAQAAKVSRATAYRYFPTQDYLLLEIGQLMPALKPVEELLAHLPDEAVEVRLRALLDRFNPVVIEQEVAMRAMLRAALDTWLENRRQGVVVPVREGRRIGWLDTVLEPVRKQLPKAQYQRLRSALALTLSIEALVTMKDVCQLGDREALAVLDWAAMALLKAGLEPPRRGPSHPSRRTA